MEIEWKAQSMNLPNIEGDNFYWRMLIIMVGSSKKLNV